jgi:hypothetical protein
MGHYRVKIRRCELRTSEYFWECEGIEWIIHIRVIYGGDDLSQIES